MRPPRHRLRRVLARLALVALALPAGMASGDSPQAVGERVEALVRRADTQRASGAYGDAARTLEVALAEAEASQDPDQRASVLGSLGALSLAQGRLDDADRALGRALELAENSRNQALAAAILNNRGSAHAERSEWGDAQNDYQTSAGLAEKTGQPTLMTRALANAARAALEGGDPRQAALLAERSRVALLLLERSPDKALLEIHLARTLSRIGDALPAERRAHRLRASALLTQALESAQELVDPRAASYALGYLGALYEDEGRVEDALSLSRRASLKAEQAGAPEALYRWQWQSGRLLAALERPSEAIAAYERAVRTLESLRQELSAGHRSPSRFQDSVGPVYFGLVDLLLRRATEAKEPERAQSLRRQARATVELLKAAELRDYFQDDCVDAMQARVRSVERASPAALVVYPISLPGRLELLVSLPSGEIQQHTVQVDAQEFRSEVYAFRRLLERRSTREYLPHAQKLHEWLIDPLESALGDPALDTIVFVPDAALRTVPMAALHDGEQFLIERYALAITPGLDLTDPRRLERKDFSLLLGGLSQSVEGFPPLSHVAGELSSIQSDIGGSLLLDDQFRREQLKKELAENRFSAVHIATHGVFASNFDETFLLAYDGRMTGDELAEAIGALRFRDRPLELLTLSACESAAGDERAALGLSGIAIKAGARSAIGTLWKVNDVAASELMVEFYRQLAHSDASRAQALRRAQQKLLADFRYQHPGYWAPFLLISNWL